jgi:gamma-glutamylputrescine oxidase
MAATDSIPYGHTWYVGTMEAAPECAPLGHDIDVDVCVVGGGLAGLTTAREIARRGWSVVVLEAERIGWSASGRNGGFVLPGFAQSINTIVERVGLKRAKELWGLSVDGMEYVRTTIRETAMAGVEPVDGWLAVRRTDNEDALIRDVALLRVDFSADVEPWPTAQVREALRSRVYFQAMHFPSAFHIHPLNYTLGLAAAAEAAGARICERTPALAIDGAGLRKRVETPKGRIRANHIVLAGGAHLGAVFPIAAETVIPLSTCAITTAPLGERLFEAVRYTGAVADTRRMCDYYRIVGGDRLLWGGRASTRLSADEGLAARLGRDMRSVFPQLGEVEIEYAWSGIIGYAVHRMPQLGEVAPGVWLAGAFGGHGMNTTAMAGMLVAHAITENDDRWRLFSPYELVWTGGSVGRVVTRAVHWSMRVRDTAAERLAQRRDPAQRQSARVTANEGAARTVRVGPAGGGLIGAVYWSTKTRDAMTEALALLRDAVRRQAAQAAASDAAAPTARPNAPTEAADRGSAGGAVTRKISMSPQAHGAAAARLAGWGDAAWRATQSAARTAGAENVGRALTRAIDWSAQVRAMAIERLAAWRLATQSAAPPIEAASIGQPGGSSSMVETQDGTRAVEPNHTPGEPADRPVSQSLAAMVRAAAAASSDRRHGEDGRDAHEPPAKTDA